MIMKTVAKGGAVLLIIICAVFLGYAQEPALNTVARAKDDKLPAHLRPSDYAVERAREMGGEVFKLLSLDVAYDRGSSFGAYYSFKDRSYASYQFSFLRGELKVGGGWSYGFYTDLGVREFRELDRTSPEAGYFLSYKPPKLEPDILGEIERLKDVKVDGVRLTRRVGVRAGHIYLLRSIDFDWADTAVVLQVLEISTDGSITIVWKKLAEFPQAIKLFMPDEEMQKKVDAVLSEIPIRGLKVKIEDNRLIPMGVDVDQEFGQLKEALHERKIPYRGIVFSMMQRSVGKTPK